ncbi:MAG: GNAT family N-acetyltransferase [Chloroflexia bacterium]
MPWGWLQPRQGALLVREATEEDREAIEGLLERARRSYHGLGGALREALREDLLLIAWQAGAPAGLAGIHRQGPEVAWIYALAIAEDASLEAVGTALLDGLEERLRPLGVAYLAYMDEYELPWLRRLLERAGFSRYTRVVGFEARADPPPDLGNREVEVRPAGPADLPAVARLDQAAFGPIWGYGERVFRGVLDTAGLFLLAEEGGETVGYILCTLHPEQRAHIVRLAVAPEHQGRHIGTRLLAEAFTALRSRGVEWIGLNTQEENRRSQRLYRRFGFRPTGEEVEVWAKRLR